jgi:hypothetical protein
MPIWHIQNTRFTWLQTVTRHQQWSVGFPQNEACSHGPWEFLRLS